MRPGRGGAVLFDIDGTLVDNSYFHAVAWWHACREMGETVPMAVLHRLVGMGGDRFVDALFHREWPELAEAHRRHIEPCFSRMVAFAGAAGLLRAVRDAGGRAVLASSASADELGRLRRIAGADDAIAAAVSACDAGTSKPAPDIFQVALDRAGTGPDRAIAIGDTRWDVEAARRTGLDCVAVRTGGWSREELAGAGAVAVYRDVGELLACLDDSPVGALLAQSTADRR